MQEEIQIKKLQYDNRDLSHKFREIVTINNAIVHEHNNEYVWKNILWAVKKYTIYRYTLDRN